MKKLLTITAILLCNCIIAQVPQALNYQAVARTADGVIIPTQNIGVRFSILDGSITGTTLYSETHTVITNSYGLFTLSIGKGTPVTSTFASINWASGTDKFLKVEIAPAGGSNFQLQGTTQLLSVPYALYSEKTRLIAGNNTINITNGNTITGNYQPANNTLLFNGNLISGNYQAANNSILLTGNQISGNYQAGTGIGISGNTISHNLVAGTGISITGNVITNTGTNLWVPDANGIHNQSGNVGIRTNSAPGVAFTVSQENTGGFSGAMDIFSSDVFHTVYRFRNTTVNQEWQFMVGGSTNIYQRPGTLGIFNTRTLRWPFYIDPNNENIGLGSNGSVMTDPKSRLHVFNGDVNIDQIGSGIILKSPNGNCWRVTIDNTGNLIRTAITCPN